MCGIAGFIDFKCNTSAEVLSAMTNALRHRGPDGNGQHMVRHDQYQLGLCHTRLSILDLSENGQQPMFFEHLVIIFNGEVYNFKEVRERLSALGHHFKTHSDTEVILHAYAKWGNDCLQHFIGMFAIVIYDKLHHDLTICIDRAGVKPLYYYQAGGLFLFASELKAFHTHPFFKKEINSQAVTEYLDFGFINAPDCIFKECHKLEAGTLMKIDLTSGQVKKEKYWRAQDWSLKQRFTGSYQEAKEQLTGLLKSAFKYRMVSDVPVGLFLSGGIDSSTLSALLTAENFKLKTFTIGFPDGKNEAPQARAIADFLGTEHHEFDCTYDQVEQIIYDLPEYFDEPLSDNSTIPTTFVSQMAREHVTVALSADGGDETFGGYRRHQAYLNYLKALKKVPAGLRKPLSSFMSPFEHLVPDMGKKYNHRIGLFARLLSSGSIERARVYESYFQVPEGIKRKLLREKNNATPSVFDRQYIPELSDADQALLWDYNIYMKDDILMKIDRATMSTSLEGREPLLDHRIWEFAATLPLDYKMGAHKRILKDILNDHIPERLTDMPKSGFSMPIHSWLKDQLRPFLEESLSENAIKDSGFFDAKEVTKMKNQFLKGQFGDIDVVWKIVHFQQWYKRWA